MSKMLLSLLLLIGTPYTAFAESPSSSLIGIPDSSEYELGCDFRNAETDGKIIFFDMSRSEIDDHGRPKLIIYWVANINGKDVKLIGPWPEKFPKKKGEKTTLKYSGENVEVILNIEQTSDCEGADCLGSSYTGRLTAISGSQKQTLKVLGSCGA